jgi:hypothetical protein
MRFVAPLALSGPLWSFLGAGITAVLATFVAIYLNAVGRKQENDARRRDLYSNAYQAALEWEEAVYRVRRRNPDGSQDYDLVDLFHDLQERIAYHQGWLSIEGKPLGEAYQAFVKEVRRQCRPLLEDAWSKPGREPTEPTPESEKRPDLTGPQATFTRAVRDHMAPWWNGLARTLKSRLIRT